jgi:hypothetical protein
MRFLIGLFFIPLFCNASQADMSGKTPHWDSDSTVETSSTTRLQGKSLTEESLGFSKEKPEGPAEANVPLPFTSLENALAFIHHQEGLHGQGLPALFWCPPTLSFKDPLEELLVREGVGLYDTSLAILVLIDAGALPEAGRLLDIYSDGHYTEETSASMDLRAAPSRYNNGAFKPFNEDTYYYFDFTNVYGDWMRWGERWKFWTVHTGPNAWLANAALHYVIALRKQGAPLKQQEPYITLAEKIGHAMQRLQDKKTQGGIRYAPENVWHEAEASDPYLELNSENNISAYATFQLLAQVTGKREYAESAERILHWLTTGAVVDAQGQPYAGLWDPASGTLAMGAIFIKDHWVLQPEHPTDAGGTWTISSLGAAKIDQLWGNGAAYRMWQRIRARSGRTATFTAVSATGTLAGLDFMDGFSIQESLISPEWSGGGLFALRELLAYYGSGAGVGQLTAAQLDGLKKDALTMNAFIHQNPNPYAIGPGHGGVRQGATGFRWSSPPPEVHAMASMYYVLASTDQSDPLADWRRLFK